MGRPHTAAVLYYDKAIEIVKRAKAREKLAFKHWGEAEERNSPLWTENKRLRDLVASYEHLVASYEQTIRHLSTERDLLATSLEDIRRAVGARL